MKNNSYLQQLKAGKSPRAFCTKIPLAMKVFIFYLFCSIGILQAAGTYAQTARISLDVNQETVANVLRQIEDASDFDFFYNNTQLDLQRRVSVSMQDSDIFRILDEVFAGTDVRYTVLDNKIILHMDYKNPVGAINELTLRFKGCGAVKYVKVTDPKTGKQVFLKRFDEE